MLKDRLCDAFCRGITVRPVPVGLAVSTGFATPDGDAIGFYVVPRGSKGNFRLEDDGTTVPMLEALGITVAAGTRARAFKALLDEYGFAHSEDTQLLHSADMPEADIPDAALRFSALLLRLQDLEFLAPRTVESTFREDAMKAIRDRFAKRVEVAESTPPSEYLKYYEADAVLKRDGHPLTAIYLGTSGSRVDEAVMLQMAIQIEHHAEQMKVVLLLEHLKNQNIPERSLARAHNRLDGIPVFRGDEVEAMTKIENITFGGSAHVH